MIKEIIGFIALEADDNWFMGVIAAVATLFLWPIMIIETIFDNRPRRDK